MSAAPRAIGWKAHAALERSAGRFAAPPGLAGSAYREAGGELIWIGARCPALHPRAVVLDADAPAAGVVDLQALFPWRPAALRPGPLEKLRVRVGAAELGCPPLAFLLEHAPGQVAALAAAVDRDNAQDAYDAALPLIGLGPGLTPSGDDFVGAALFARRLLDASDAWTLAAQRLVAAARERTHVIAAALFADLAQAQSFAPLHRLAAALAAGAPALPAARALAAIGHSSGRDMLAGFLVGAAGSAALTHGGQE